MSPEADNSLLPTMPGNDLVEQWLKDIFPGEVVLNISRSVRDGRMVEEKKMGHVKLDRVTRLFLDAQAEGGCAFLKRHLILEVSVEGQVFTGARSINGPWTFGGGSAPVAYDGQEFLLLQGLGRDENLAAVLRAEELQPDAASPAEMARFFNEICGTWHEQILNFPVAANVVSQQHSLPTRVPMDRDRATVPAPSIVSDPGGGWILDYWCLRWQGGCTPSLPLLFEYKIKLSPQLDVTVHEISKRLEQKYGIAVWERGEKDGVPWANPRRQYSDEEIQILIAALRDDFVGTRGEAVEALRELNTLRQRTAGSKYTPAALAIPALFECLAEKDKFDCAGFSYSAIEDHLVGSLCQIVRDTEVTEALKSYAPALLPYLYDQHMRYSTLLALKYLKPAGVHAGKIIEAINVLRGQDESKWGRRTHSRNCYYDADWVDLIDILGLMEPPARDAVPFLEGLISSDADAVTKESAYKSLQAINKALGESKSDDTVAFHLRVLKTENDPTLYLTSLVALARIKPTPPEVWPALLELLSNPSPNMRLSAIRTIDELGPSAAHLLPELLGFGKSPYFAGARHEDGYGQREYEAALAAIDPDGTQTIKYMKPALDEAAKCESAAQLLLRIGAPQCWAVVEEKQKPLVYAVRFSPDGRHLVAGFADGTIKIWDVITGNMLRSITSRAGTILALEISPDGRTLAASYVGNGMKVILWDAARGQEKGAISTHARGSSSLSFNPAGDTVASASRSFEIKLWDVASGAVREIATEDHNYSPSAAAFSPDGRTLASGGIHFTSVKLRPDGSLQQAMGNQGKIILFDVTSGKEIRALPGDAPDVISLAFRPDGKLLATGGSGGIKLWNLDTDADMRAIFQTRGTTRQVVFSPDGLMLASTSCNSGVLGLLAGQNISLWDVATGAEVRSWMAHPFGTLSLAFNPGGQILASAGAGGVKLWDFSSGKQVGSFI